jgi:hypothetical protein
MCCDHRSSPRTKGPENFTVLLHQVHPGAKHITLDPIGENPFRFRLSKINNDEQALVTIAEGEEHRLNDGDFVRFEDVEGMFSLNGESFEIAQVVSNTALSATEPSFRPTNGSIDPVMAIKISNQSKYRFYHSRRLSSRLNRSTSYSTTEPKDATSKLSSHSSLLSESLTDREATLPLFQSLISLKQREN